MTVETSTVQVLLHDLLDYELRPGHHALHLQELLEGRDVEFLQEVFGQLLEVDVGQLDLLADLEVHLLLGHVLAIDLGIL